MKTDKYPKSLPKKWTAMIKLPLKARIEELEKEKTEIGGGK